jgi:16S rRNA (uracil1498-N3)-methyltransferase
MVNREEYKNLHRLYVQSSIKIGAKNELDSHQSFYLKSVLRKKSQDSLIIFNEKDGEYLAEISDQHSCTPKEILRSPPSQNDQKSGTINVALALCKKFSEAVVMATQLGATSIQPIITHHCQVRNLNVSRIEKCIIEASEQSWRIDVPQLLNQMRLEDFLRHSDLNTTSIFFANERETNKTLAQFSQSIKSNNITLLIGPEGGFSSTEENTIKSYSSVSSFCLSENILRVETAVAASVFWAKMLLKKA